MSEDEASTINPIVESFLRHEVNRYQKKLKHQRRSWPLLENLQTMYNINMTDQETQTQDTTVPNLPSCNHEKEINDQVMKKLEITHQQLLEHHSDVYNNFMQDITRDYEKRVNENKKLRCEIEQQKIQLQEAEKCLAYLKSRSIHQGY